MAVIPRAVHRLSLPIALAVLVVVGTACEVGSTGVIIVEPVPSAQDPPGSAWIGFYQGAGTGSLAGQSVMPEGVTLSIRLDVDSVRLPTCPACLTVQLDTLFALVNVEPDSEVSLRLEYSDAGVMRALELDRFSGGGSIGNVVIARLALSGGVSGAVEYLLERR